MPIFQKLINLDEKYNNLKYEPVLINDLENKTEEEREHINNSISTCYTSDNMSLIPSCQCGVTKGTYSLNTKCPTCDTEVVSDSESDISSLLWVRKPLGVLKFINPIVLIMLKDRFTKSGLNVMSYLMDTSYKLKSNSRTATTLLLAVENLQLGRGYNNFIDNFDVIIEKLFAMKEFRLKYGIDDSLYRLLHRDRDKLFADNLPLPNKSLLIIERTHFGVISDKIALKAIDAIQMMVGIDEMDVSRNIVRENRTFRALDKLCEYYNDFFKEKLNKKRRIFRGHVYGTRTNFSARMVITNLMGKHDYNEVHIPWGVGLILFRPHLINKLSKLGLSHNAAISRIFSSINKYDEILNGLLEEFYLTYGPTYVCIGRNPSLLQGSILRMKIGNIKKDVKDTTMGIPIGVCNSLNADFDGDAMYLSLSLDKKMDNLLYSFDPKFNVLVMNTPHKTSRNIGISKSVIAATSQWLES